MIWWFCLAGSSVGFTMGSLLLKRFADGAGIATLTASIAILALSNVFFVQVIRNGLGQGVVASSMSQVILMAAFGVLVFGERLSMVQVLGVAMAAASLFLITGSGAEAG